MMALSDSTWLFALNVCHMQFQMTYHEADLLLGGSGSMIQALTDILSIKNENR